MAQATDFTLSNQAFGTFRTELNSVLSAVNSCQSGTTTPPSAVAGTIWLDTTSATTPTLKYYDGTDNISLATIDHVGNTVNWLDSTVSVTGLTSTATGTVLTLTDSVSTSTVNLIIDNQKEIRFRETTANGTNYVALKAPASLSADFTFTLPNSYGTNGQVLTSDGSGGLSFTSLASGGITDLVDDTTPQLGGNLDVQTNSVVTTANRNVKVYPNGTGVLEVGGSTNSGRIQLNCEQNTHGIKLASPPHSAGQSYTLTFPSTAPSAGKVLETDGSGNLSFATVSGGATQLVSSIPLASGGSLTAGRGVFLNSSGQVALYPTLNTLGTEYANASATAYTVFSNNGSRAIKISTSGTSTFTVTYTGVAITGTATPTDGTTTVTSVTTTPNNTTNYSQVNAFPISDTEFYVVHSAGNGFVNSSTNTGVNTKHFVITVDASGNCTKGSEVTLNSPNTAGSFGNFSGVTVGKISNEIFAIQLLLSIDYVYSYTFRTATISGTTVTLTSDAEAGSFVGIATGFTNVYTTNNIIGCGTGNNWVTAPYTAGNIGTVTTTATITDANTTPAWFKITDARVLVYYQDTSLLYKLRTYDVNQTTGALTLVDTEFLTGTAWASSAGNFRFKNQTSGVFKYLVSGFYYVNSIELDSNGNFVGFNLGSKLDIADLTPVYNTSDDFFINYYVTNPKLKKYTVSAYSTSLPNYLGFAKETDNTTPVNIVTDGVAGGLSGLTSGSLYYISTNYDGTVSTDSTSGIFVGKAISATEILLQRSNSQ